MNSEVSGILAGMDGKNITSVHISLAVVVVAALVPVIATQLAQTVKTQLARDAQMRVGLVDSCSLTATETESEIHFSGCNSII